MTLLSSALNSSAIQFAVYNTDNLDLTLVFRSGSAYVYFDVALDVYEDLDSAESAGVFFQDNIRNVYDAFEVDLQDALSLVSEASYHNFNSSFLRTAQYNRESGIATVTLNNGRSYSYLLGNIAWNQFITAQSSGAYFNNFISRLAQRV